MHFRMTEVMLRWDLAKLLHGESYNSMGTDPLVCATALHTPKSPRLKGGRFRYHCNLRARSIGAGAIHRHLNAIVKDLSLKAEIVSTPGDVSFTSDFAQGQNWRGRLCGAQLADRRYPPDKLALCWPVRALPQYRQRRHAR